MNFAVRSSASGRQPRSIDSHQPRRWGWLIAVLSIAGAMAGGPAHAAIFKDAELQALVDSGQTDELEQLATRRLKSQPDAAEPAAALTLAQLDLADTNVLSQNLQRMEQCVARRPQEASCHYALALAMVMQARHGSKIKALGSLGRVSELMQTAMKLLPDAPEPRSALQQYYLALPSFVGGGESRAQALEQGVQDADQLRLLRARAAAAKKDWATVERELRAVRTQRPELLLELRLIWSDLGREWMHRDQHAKAKAWFEQLMKQQPRQAAGAYGLGRVLDAMGQHDEAVAMYERARGLLGAEQLALEHRIGIALQAKGDKAGAKAAFERYLTQRRASPGNVEDSRKRLGELAT